MKRQISWRHRPVCLGFVLILVLGGRGAQADFTFGPATNLGPGINSATYDGGPAVSPDGLELYFYSFFQGFGIPTVRIATRQNDQDPWGSAQSAGGLPFSGTSLCFSPDGLTLFYESFQAGGLGQTDIWMTTRNTLSDPWGPTVNLGSGVNSPATDMGVTLSSDGRELYFGSDRPGGIGDWDVYVSTRATTADPWGPAVNLGPGINSSVYDGHPHIAPDDLTLFVTSARPGGYGDWDIWFTKRHDRQSPWGPLVNVGPALNTAAGEVEPCISADGRTLYLSDGYVPRSGGVGGTDLWQVPILPVVDFNGDGKVDGADILSMAAHWDQEYPACDIGPTPFGDGVVDVEDLRVLAEYIGSELTDPTLLAHWAMDEATGGVATDSAGGHDGTIVGLPTWQPGGGQVDGALECNGTFFIVADFVLDPAAGPFSVLAWVKGGLPGQTIVSQQGGAAWLLADAVTGALKSDVGGGGRISEPLICDAVITDDRWHRIGFTWDGSNRMLYVDGTLVAQDTLEAVSGAQGKMVLGAAPTMSPTTYWSGLIDDVRIYNRAVRP